jgi:proline dehydrogenase
VPDRSRSEASALLEAPVLGRLLAGRWAAGPSVDDAVRVAAELVAAGRRVALEHVPGRADDAAAELVTLLRRAAGAGLSAACELAVPLERLGEVGAREVAVEAADAGVAVVLTGPAGAVDALRAELPGAGVAVPAGEPGAEARCRALADGRVRLVEGRGARGDLAFVRCLNVLMAGGGWPEIATADPRLVAITGERAAWNGRPHESWEQVMPYGIRTGEQHRLVAAGHSVRVAVPSGRGAVALVARTLAGRS